MRASTARASRADALPGPVPLTPDDIDAVSGGGLAVLAEPAVSVIARRNPAMWDAIIPHSVTVAAQAAR